MNENELRKAIWMPCQDYGYTDDSVATKLGELIATLRTDNEKD